MKAETTYKDTLKELTDRILKRLHDSIESIVLYGSVARKAHDRESDIDVLIVSRDVSKAEKIVLDIGYDIDYRNDFETFIVPVYYTPEELEHEADAGSFFIKNVLEQGVVLYDRGTFARIRKKALATG